MEKLNYNSLDNVFLDDYELIVPSYSYVYQFCIRNKIYTLGELLRKVDSNKLEFKNEGFKEELLGFVDLVKYIHFGIKLPEELVFEEVITFVPNSKKGHYHQYLSEVSYNSVFKNPLRRLGFTYKECNFLELFVKDNKKSMSIIDIIYNYTCLSKRKFGYKELGDIFVKKLMIYVEYYNKYCKDNAFQAKKLSELSDLLYRLKELKQKYEEIGCSINQIEKEICEKSKFMDKEQVNRLVKKYELK